MEAETEQRIKRMKSKLEEMQVDYLQPPNPYCQTVVLMGTADDPAVLLRFWRGEPEAVELCRPEFCLKRVPRLAAAMERAEQILEEFPA